MTGGNSSTDTRPLRIFLSYAIPDQPFADRLKTLLAQAQKGPYRVFTTASLSAGEDWSAQLRKEIAQADVFIVLLSPESAESTWVLQDLGAAWALEKPIIPIVTQPEAYIHLPIELKETRLVPFQALDSADAVRQLLEPYANRIAEPHTGH